MMIFPRLIFAAAILSYGLFLFYPMASAADSDDFSPWDGWRQGYTHFERGEQARDRGDYVQALQSFRESLRCYREVKRARPDWNQTVIDTRISLCEQEIAAIRRLMGRPTGTGSADSRDPALTSAPASGTPASVVPENTARLQAELEQYKQKLFSALVELEDLRKSAAQRSATTTELENLMRERRIMQEKYQLLESRYQELEKKSSEPDAAAEAARRQMIELRINLETTERKLKLATDRNLAMEHDLAELQRTRLQLEKELKEAQLLAAANREELASLRQIRDSATGEKNLILAREETLKQSLERAEKQLAANRTELETLQKRLLTAARPDGGAALNQEIAEENRKLRDDAGKIRTELEEAVRTRSQLQNQLRENKLELTDVRGALQRVDDRRKQAEDENSLLRTQLEKELASRELNSTELRKLRERNQQLEDDLKLWADKLEKAEQRLNQRSQSDYATVSGLNAERRKQDEAISKLKLETTNLKLQLESTSEKLRKAETAATESRTEMLKQKAAVLSAEQESAKAKTVAAELATAQRNLAAAQLELRDARKLRKDVEELQKALTAAREQAAAGETAAKQLAEQQRINQQLLDENTRLKQRPGTVATGGVASQLPAAAVSPTQLNELLQNARKAEKENAREVALWNYRTILDSRPNHAEANLGFGRILLQQEQYEDAENPLHQAHLADPAALPARLAYAQCLLGLKKYGNALALLEPVAKDRKNDGDFQLTLGRAYAGARQFQKAEQSFRAAMAVQPEKPAPQLALARLLADLPDRRDEAARFYGQAKKLGAAPDAALEKTLGQLLNERSDLIDFLAEAAREAENHGDIHSALWYYGQLRDMAPESGLFAEKLAAYRLLRGQNDEALAALKDRPATAGSAIVRAFIHLRNAQYPETTAAAAEALLLNQSEKWPLPKTMKPLLSELDKAPAEAASAVASLRGAIAE